MSYTYKHHIPSTINSQYIIEFENIEFKIIKPFRYWDLSFLKKDFKDLTIFNKEQEDSDSFERTKKWTRTNHPELLM
jgi:hypothetical protein